MFRRCGSPANTMRNIAEVPRGHRSDWRIPNCGFVPTPATVFRGNSLKSSSIGCENSFNLADLGINFDHLAGRCAWILEEMSGEHARDAIGIAHHSRRAK